MIRYSEEIIEEVRNANDIVDVISQYVVLKRSGRNFFGLCPFHKEKSPSFSVSPDKQIFHCFGCGVGGNVIHFVSKIEGTNFIETMQMLAERANVTLTQLESTENDETLVLKQKLYQINEIAAKFYHDLLYQPESKLAQEYVKKRKLDNQTLQNFLIGYAGTQNQLYTYLREKGFTENEIMKSNLIYKTKNGNYLDRFRNRLIFPIQDIKNRVIAFGGRVLDNSLPKYINSPEGLIYSKGRHLYGLNVAKKYALDKIIIVEGYMDCVSLHQRGVHNVVASLGTALTEAQGRLLRRYGGQVVIGYDEDGAGQNATMRGLEILNNLGCDLRILQWDGAKDPDEYVIKYGSGRFNRQVDQAISLVEFKIKNLKKTMNLENVNDKIKFLMEIAKIISNIDNKMEQEIYIDKISQEYNISKEAIYSQINKLLYANMAGSKTLEVKKVNRVSIHQEKIRKQEQILESDQKREKILIWLLIHDPQKTYQAVKDVIPVQTIKIEKNREIIKKLYEEYEKGNSNISQILDTFEQDVVDYLTGIMAENLEITDINKGIREILTNFQKSQLYAKKKEILQKLEQEGLSEEESQNLEQELTQVIYQISKLK